VKQACTTILLLAAASAALADEVAMETGLKYGAAKVSGVNKKGEIEFAWSGRRFTQPLAKVKQIVLDGEEQFNQAEKTLAAGQHAQAARAYDTAFGLTRAPWMKELIRYRRLKARDGAGQAYAALEDWLALMEATRSAEAVRERAPSNLPKAGSTEQKRVRALLESHRAKAQRSRDEVFVAAIDALLKAVEAGGPQTPDEKSPARKDPKGNGPGGLMVNQEVTTGVDYGGVLKTASSLLSKSNASAQDAKRALGLLDANIGKFGHGDLSGALLLRGQARQRLARAAAGDEQRMMLERAGLDFMRVAVLYPESVEAPFAMCLAGEVNEALGNPSAARNAYEAVLSRFEGNEKMVARARAALKRLSAEP